MAVLPAGWALPTVTPWLPLVLLLRRASAYLGQEPWSPLHGPPGGAVSEEMGATSWDLGTGPEGTSPELCPQLNGESCGPGPLLFLPGSPLRALASGGRPSPCGFGEVLLGGKERSELIK